MEVVIPGAKQRLLHIQPVSPLLGTAPALEDVADNYVRAKAIADGKRPEELTGDLPEPLGDERDKRRTVFWVNRDGVPQWMAFQIHGAFKEAAVLLRKANTPEGKRKSPNLPALEDRVRSNLRIFPSALPLPGDLKDRHRPIKAMTAQGPRISLLMSQEAFADLFLADDAGPVFTWRVKVLAGTVLDNASVLDAFPALIEWTGVLQWRTSSLFGQVRAWWCSGEPTCQPGVGGGGCEYPA